MCLTYKVNQREQYTHSGVYQHSPRIPSSGVPPPGSLLLHPCYTPNARSTRHIVRSVRTWPEDAIPRLQECFKTTDWDVFRGQEGLARSSLDEFNVSVLDYRLLCDYWHIFVAGLCRSKPKTLHDGKAEIIN